MTAPRQTRTRRALLFAAVSFTLMALLTAILYRMSTFKPLDHDEHQFIASGALLAREGLLPYRDAPYHHLPYLSFVYAALFGWCGDLLGSARGFSVACATGLTALLATCAFRTFHDRSTALRCLAAGASVAVLLSNPLFVYTSGRAWNHDLAVLLAVGATLLHLDWLERIASTRSAITIGLLLGAAIGVRSSFALTIPAFLFSFALLGERDGRSRVRAIAAFGVGGAIALLPVALLFFAAPDRFSFGNLEYNLRLNTEYRAAMGWSAAMDFSGKLSYVGDEILSHRRNFWLCLTALAALVSLGGGRFATRRRSTILFLVLLLAAIVSGAWAPTPSWYQYFYPAVPFLILFLLLTFADFADMRAPLIPVLCATCLTATTLAGLRHYQVALTGRPDESQTELVAAIGERIAELTPPGRILTLAPLFALQGRRHVYPWLATGVFSWRTAALVRAERRAELGLVGPEDLNAAVAMDPPVAVILGVEVESPEALEEPFAALARSLGFAPHPLPGGFELWTAAAR